MMLLGPKLDVLKNVLSDYLCWKELLEAQSAMHLLYLLINWVMQCAVHLHALGWLKALSAGMQCTVAVQ